MQLTAKHIQRLKVLFLLGLIACIVSMWVVVGKSILSGIVTLIGVLVVILNNLLGWTTPGTTLDNRALTFLKAGLNKPTLLVSATILVWSATLIVAGAGYERRQSERLRNAPFRVVYYTVGGHGIDLLVRGEIEEPIKQVFGGEPFVIPNSTLRETAMLAKKYRTANPHATASLDIGLPPDQTVAEYPALEASLDTIKFSDPMFVGGFRTERIAISAKTPSFDLSRQPDTWHGFVVDYGEPHELLVPARQQGEAMFWRFASTKDIETVAKGEIWLQFYRQIVGESSPSDFCILLFDVMEECDGLYGLQLIPREMRIRVALIENTTTTSIYIDGFSLRKSRKTQLRSKANDDEDLNRVGVEVEDSFPQHILKPGEKILVPLRMGLVFDDGSDLGFGFANASASKRDALLLKLKKADTVQFPANPAVNVKAMSVIKALNKDNSVDPFLMPEYVWGPSERVESIQANGTIYPVRAENPKTFIIRSQYEFGSCPIVYTRIPNGNWQNEGRILTGRISRARSGTDELRLQRFDGSVLLREIEPEMSFFDSLYVVLKLRNGREVRLYPTNVNLGKGSGHQLRLKPWEQVEVHFEKSLASDAASQIVLVASGYYVRSESRSSSAQEPTVIP